MVALVHTTPSLVVMGQCPWLNGIMRIICFFKHFLNTAICYNVVVNVMMKVITNIITTTSTVDPDIPESPDIALLVEHSKIACT